MLVVVFHFRSVFGHLNNSFFNKKNLYPIEDIDFQSSNVALTIHKMHHYEASQTVNWLGAYYCVCMFLDSRDKPFNMFC